MADGNVGQPVFDIRRFVAGLLLSELDREEVRILHHEPQCTGLSASDETSLPFVRLDGLLDCVTDKVAAVGQGESRIGLPDVMNFDWTLRLRWSSN